jgi:hypothetical protein
MVNLERLHRKFHFCATFHRFQLFQIQVEVFDTSILSQLSQTCDELVNHLVFLVEVLIAFFFRLNLDHGFEPTDYFVRTDLARFVCSVVVREDLPERC